jgi:hypothetical protein
MRGMLLGNLTLPASRDEMIEACLEQLKTTNVVHCLPSYH